MAVSWTSRGIREFTAWLDGGSVPSALRLRLTRDVPTWATKSMSELTEIPNGNGYSALNVNPSLTNWPTESENDDEGARFLERASRQRSWNASGGDIPSSGDGFMAVVLTDTGGNPNVIAYIDLGRKRTVLSGTSLTIPSLALRFAEGRLPRGIGGGDVASLPQSAYLDQNNAVAHTWYDLLDYTSGSGYLHYVRVAQTAATILPDVRITVDGTASTLNYDDSTIDADMGAGSDQLNRVRNIPLHVRFDSSLKVEVRYAVASRIRAKCYYSTDL